MKYLAHYGIKGQKWGVRRFENEDGTLTPQGRARYLGDMAKAAKSYMADRRKNVKRYYKRAGGTEDLYPDEMTKKQRETYDKANKLYKKDQETSKKRFLNNIKDINERRKAEKNLQKLEKLKKQARHQSFNPLKAGINAVIGDRIGGTVAAIGASLVSSYTNVAISSEETSAYIEAGRNLGRKLGIAYEGIQTAQGYRARQKLYGNGNAIAWVEENNRSNRSNRR